MISSPGLTTCEGSDTRDQPISRHVQQALHPAAEIDERAELAHGRDAAGEHGARNDDRRLQRRAPSLLFLEKRTPRDDEAFRLPCIR